jgi:hypothetical protein
VREGARVGYTWGDGTVRRRLQGRHLDVEHANTDLEARGLKVGRCYVGIAESGGGI